MLTKIKQWLINILIFSMILTGSALPSSGKEPLAVILDTDIDSDVDDVGTLAMLHALADNDEVEILAIIVTSDEKWSPSCADAINTYYSRPDIPIGVLKGQELSTFSKYAKTIAEEFPHDLKSFEDAFDATELYRRVLASQPERSVAIITVGHLTNFNNLLKSKEIPSFCNNQNKCNACGLKQDCFNEKKIKNLINKNQKF